MGLWWHQFHIIQIWFLSFESLLSKEWNRFEDRSLGMCWRLKCVYLNSLCRTYLRNQDTCEHFHDCDGKWPLLLVWYSVGPLPWFGFRWRSFIRHSSRTICENVNTGNKANNLLVWLWKQVLPCEFPEITLKILEVRDSHFKYGSSRYRISKEEGRHIVSF